MGFGTGECEGAALGANVVGAFVGAGIAVMKTAANVVEPMLLPSNVTVTVPELLSATIDRTSPLVSSTSALPEMRTWLAVPAAAKAEAYAMFVVVEPETRWT